VAIFGLHVVMLSCGGVMWLFVTASCLLSYWRLFICISFFVAKWRGGISAAACGLLCVVGFGWRRMATSVVNPILTDDGVAADV